MQIRGNTNTEKKKQNDTISLNCQDLNTSTRASTILPFASSGQLSTDNCQRNMTNNCASTYIKHTETDNNNKHGGEKEGDERGAEQREERQLRGGGEETEPQ